MAAPDKPPRLDMVLVDPSRPLPNRVEDRLRPGTEEQRRMQIPGIVMAAGDRRDEPALRCVYRAVYTTSGAIFGDGELACEGALIKWGNGSVVYGYMSHGDAFPGRNPGEPQIPERGRLVPHGDFWRYENLGPATRQDGGSRAIGSTTPGPTIGGYAGGSIDDVFFVELLVEIDDVMPYETALAQGQRRSAPYKTSIDLYFGPRLLATRVTEEVGYLDDAGRYSQFAVSAPVALAWTQALSLAVEPDHFGGWARASVARYGVLDQARQRRVALASDWYQRAIADADPILSYLQYWLVLEILGMPNATDIEPACARLAEHLGRDLQAWFRVLRPLRNTRGSIAHQGKRDVTPDERDRLAALAEVFLGFEFGVEPHAAVATLREAAAASTTDRG